MRLPLSIGIFAAAIGSICCAAVVQTVDQKGLAFSVPELTIKKGSYVRFTNSDATAHNILISVQGKTVNGGLQQPGSAFNVPFMKTGAYQITCGIHPKMKMRVVVQ